LLVGDTNAGFGVRGGEVAFVPVAFVPVVSLAVGAEPEPKLHIARPNAVKLFSSFRAIETFSF
jgi:hypothetical protein